MPTIKTGEQVRREFERKGVSITAWARANDVSRRTAYNVIAGLNKGRRGQAHKVAVLLGMKDGEIVQ